VIQEFQGDYRWLSNFWPARVGLDGVFYPTVEHAYQAGKTIIRAERHDIWLAPSPGKAKRWGKNVTLRPDWEVVKLSIMEALLRQKFAQYQMYEKLLATEDQQIVEGNRWHDNYWGDCLCQNCVTVPGHNWMGYLIEKIRLEMFVARSKTLARIEK